MNIKLLVTGANGFLGRAFVVESIRRGLPLRGVMRASPKENLTGLHVYIAPDINGVIDWTTALQGVEYMVHFAARVHVMKDFTVDPLAEFRRVNVAGTLNLAQQAALAGVKRFIFISSIKVNGEQTKVGQPFTEKDRFNSFDPYGISKYEAEEGLRLIAKETGMEVVIIRPALVYGFGVKGNFLSMMCWLHKGIPLPLGAINNVRSLVALDNLIDFIITCLHHPMAANETFLVSDGEDLSTTQLLQYTLAAMQVKPWLIPIPTSIIQTGAKLLGKSEVAKRLCCNLQVDITKARQLLGWAPPISVREGLRRAVEGYVQSRKELK